MAGVIVKSLSQVATMMKRHSGETAIHDQVFQTVLFEDGEVMDVSGMNFPDKAVKMTAHMNNVELV